MNRLPPTASVGAWAPPRGFTVHDRAFAAVLGDAARLEQVAVTDAHEGPVYAADEDALYFTTVRAERVSVKRLELRNGTVSVVREDANMANGMAIDREGRLLVCEQGTLERAARISRLDRETGEAETLVDSWASVRLNSPNDIVVSRDGAVWFTDPTYGFLQGFRPQPVAGEHVYRFDPRTGRLTVVADSFDKPNGLAFSPDESVLYVGDSGAIHAPDDYDPARPRRVAALDVAAGRLLNERTFAAGIPGFPDGLETDAAGRVYVSAATGVIVFDPSGDLLGQVDLPGAVNFTFGGPDRNVLYITADTAVWAAVLEAKGA
jgi:gluconolactonase